MIWYSHLFQNFPQFIVIHTVKGFGIVNRAEIDVFLELSCFFDDPVNVDNLISGSSAFSKTSLNIWKFMVHGSCIAETPIQFLGQEDPLEKGQATHSSILAWRIPWTEESGRLQSTGLQRVRPIEQLHFHFASL